MERTVGSILRYRHRGKRPSSCVVSLREACGQLLGRTERLKARCLASRLMARFLSSSGDSQSNRCHCGEFLTRGQYVHFLRSCLRAKGMSVGGFRRPIKRTVSSNFTRILALCSRTRRTSNLDRTSLVGGHHPVQCLLRCVASLKCRGLSSVRRKSAIGTVRSVLSGRCSPADLMATVSKVHHFCRVFPRVQRFELRVPSQVPQGHSVVSMCSRTRRRGVTSFLSSSNVSHQSATVYLLSFRAKLHDISVYGLELKSIS